MAKSQREAVVEHLKKHKKITSLEAFERYGITRLSSIIFKIRKANGIGCITSVEKKTKSRYNNIVRYSEYTLTGELDNECKRVDTEM